MSRVGPEDRLSSGQPLLRIQLLPTKACITKVIEGAQKPDCLKDAVQLLWRAHFSSDPAQDFCWGMPMVITMAMPPMWLLIVIFDKAPVRLFGSFPTSDQFEVIIPHPSHNREYVE